ncbi:hypothetical protein TNCV_180751 [Trichonephila clavipes]|nr:hypothetical protein TNCV_180751 [Trichonephila clavipes]
MPAMVGYLNHWATAAPHELEGRPYLQCKVEVPDGTKEWTAVETGVSYLDSFCKIGYIARLFAKSAEEKQMVADN